MPEPEPRRSPNLLRLDPPTWLRQAVEPWRVDAAALFRSGGLRLSLRSERAAIPVLVELGERGSLPRISILDERIAPAHAAKFVRALAGSLARTAELRPYLERLASVADTLHRPGDDSDIGVLIECWRAWPEREADPARGVAELPAGVEALSLARPARAALVLHRLARGQSGDVIAALSSWAELGSAETAPGFIEQLVDAAALALLGRRSEALAALAHAQAQAGDGPEHLAVARGYENLDDKPAAHAAHERVVESRGSGWDRLRLARVRGDFGSGESPPQPDAGASPSERVSFVRQVVKVLDTAGRYDDALASINALLAELGEAEAPRDLILRAATLHLWRCEGEPARARLALLRTDATQDEHVSLILGALAVLDGEPERALELLRGHEGGSTRLERLLWTAEAQLALGHFEQALDAVDEHIKLENSLVAYLLKLLIFVHTAHTRTPTELADSLASRTFLDALVADVLPSLCDAERLSAAKAAAKTDPSQFAALIRELLDDMGGNRSAKPTWCRRLAETHGERGPLERVVVRPSGRDAAVANLVRIRTEPPDAVLAGFEAVVAAYPKSPHPWTYRGELLIWLGRYHDALASFDEADARAPTRWSYVGRAAAHDLLGDAAQADHWTSEGVRRFGELETATTHVYRGERLRKLADWPAARRDLETAVAYKTRRVGARINLALSHRALGDEAGWEREIDRLIDDAPALLWEAGVRPDRRPEPETLLAVLELMVGNRSSFLHTMIDTEGRFRVIPAPSRWIAFARLCVAVARPAVEAELAARHGL